jgi:hypothetical protein
MSLSSTFLAGSAIELAFLVIVWFDRANDLVSQYLLRSSFTVPVLAEIAAVVLAVTYYVIQFFLLMFLV